MRKLLIGVVAATMAIAACGGSSKKDTSAGANGSATTTAGKSTGGVTNTTSSGSNDGGGSSDFSKTRIKITYVEDDGSGSKSTLTIALSGDGKSAFSDSEAGDDPTDASTIYSDGKTNVDCQGTGPTAKCTEVAAAGVDAAGGFTAGFDAIATVVATLGGGDKSSDSIAGRDVSCVKYKAVDAIAKLAANPFFKDTDDKVSDYNASDTLSICLDKKTGFPLRFSGTKKGVAQDGLTATAVSDPTDADFVPPSTPVTIPSAGGITVPTTAG